MDDADHHQQDRRPDAEGGVAGDQADQRGAYAHQAEGDHQHVLAAEAVAQVAEQDAAERAGDEADGEGGEGQQGGHRRVAGVEEDLRENDRGHGRVEVEVIPLQHRTEDGRRRDLAQALALLVGGFRRGRGRFMCRHGLFLIVFVVEGAAEISGP